MAKDTPMDGAAGARTALPAAESHEQGPKKRPESEKDRRIMAKDIETPGAILNCDPR